MKVIPGRQPLSPKLWSGGIAASDVVCRPTRIRRLRGRGGSSVVESRPSSGALG